MHGSAGDADEALASALEAAERWAVLDPDPTTRAEIDRLIDDQDPALISLFGDRLRFGTAGLRGPVGPGPARMNAMVVRQATAAVIDHLTAAAPAGLVPTVLIGFDARPDSAMFATHAAAAVSAGGGRPLMADRALPTPVVAHAARSQAADAAIVITASHNPAGDNGYKLYLDRGRQLVAPVDAAIAARIDELAASWVARSIAIDDVLQRLHDGQDSVTPIDADEWVVAHRRDAIRATEPFALPALRVAYTALHGVGGQPTVEAFRAAGLAEPDVVVEQFEPDGSFPTAPFPNPEEPGALDALLAMADHAQSDLALAHDPDADRLAVAVPGRAGDGFTVLSGDQLGVLLGDHVLRRLGSAATAGVVVARSVVSSRWLDAIARAAGATVEVTLTGFKWIARAADRHPSAVFAFGYEEAIGYAIGDHVADKDGITAALAAVAMVGDLAASGHTVWERLDALSVAHGVHRTAPVTVRFDADPAQVDAMVTRLVMAPPRSVGGVDVAMVGPIGQGELPPTPGLELRLADASSVIVRPSGTEPKVKAYIEVVEPVDPTISDALAQATRASDDRLARLVEAVGELLSPPAGRSLR